MIIDTPLVPVQKAVQEHCVPALVERYMKKFSNLRLNDNRKH